MCVTGVWKITDSPTECHVLKFSTASSLDTEVKGTNEQKASFILTLTNSLVQKLEETLLTFLTALLDSKTLQEVIPSLKKWPSNVNALSRLVSTRLVQSLKRDGESGGGVMAVFYTISGSNI